MTSYLSICAVYRDEAPYLREWVEFHRLVGVERFFLYNNDSVDEHREVLAHISTTARSRSMTGPNGRRSPGLRRLPRSAIGRTRGGSRSSTWTSSCFARRARRCRSCCANTRSSRSGSELGGVRIVGHRTRPPRARARVICAAHGRSRDQPAHQVDRRPARVRAFCLHALLHVRPGARGGRAAPTDHRPPFSHTEGVSFERLRLEPLRH